MSKTGICYLVGAGPGDLGLVTLRAKELIERADVLDDLDAEKKGIEDFWNNYVLTDKEPPMIIQGL